MSDKDYLEYINKKTLIIGPLKSGKTKLLSKILMSFIKAGLSDDIIVLDFSPRQIGDVGGLVSNYINVENILYFAPENIRAPRFQGKSASDVIKLAEENREVLEGYIDIAIKEDKKALFINDITLYLHRGDIDKIIKLLNSKRTAVVTAYYGENFDDKGSGINIREREAVKILMKKVDKVIKLGLKREY